MNFVAFETSSDTLSVAVTRGDVTTSEEIADAGQKNSELTLPLMHRLLASSSLSLSEIDVVVFGQGPGSFTGVRIACGLAQGLAFGLGKRVIALPTTLVLAKQAYANVDVSNPMSDHANIIVAIDARMGEVYFAAYHRDESADSGFVEVVAPMLTKPDQLPELAGEWCAIGSAFSDMALHDAMFKNMNGKIQAVIEPSLPQSYFLSAIARRLYSRLGDTCTIHSRDAAPIYLRNNVAMTIEERRLFHAAKRQQQAAA